MVNNDTTPSFHSVFVARQPVYTQEQSVWGYELFFQQSEDELPETHDTQQHANVAVMADGIMMAQQSISADKRLLINMHPSLLTTEAVLALQPQQCVPEISARIRPTQRIIEACRKLKHEGFMLSLDCYTGQKAIEPLLPYMDIIKVSVSGFTYNAMFTLASRLLKKKRYLLLAEDVTEEPFLEGSKAMGFSLFQGELFGKPQTVAGRKVSTSEAVKLDLLSYLKSEMDIHDLSRRIGQDVSLSYRLLRYVNSPTFGTRYEIRTIDQALVVLGERIIRQWLTVVLMADMNVTPPAKEITYLSVLRGKFMELFAEADHIDYLDPDEAFLVGMFSSMDTLLAQPMSEIADMLPVANSAKLAFLGEPNRIRNILDFLGALENANWTLAAALLPELGITMPEAAQMRAKAMEWAASVLNGTAG